MRSSLQKQVIVGLSGGVDSAVAALLLKRQGYAVEGLFMHNWEDDEEGYCTAAEDFQDALQVSRELDIPLHRVNFADEYRERVFRHFLEEYSAGRTPNPDVLCNSEIKFQAFLEHALRLGADCIATGHYARLAHSGGTAQLLKAADPAKDQTYFLHAVSQRALGQAIFPLGDLHKGRVRELAREAGFANHAKKDSTGICFIGERRFREFLGRYLPAQPGDMCTPDGRRLGRHNGLMYYTLGQRQGLGIGGRREAGDAPWYVVDKDLDNNVLVVGQGADHPRLFSEALRTGTPHWIAGHPPVVPMHCEARLRHRQPVQACEVHTLPTGGLEVVFEQPQRAVTPGQYAVFYKGDLCLGGAVIEERVAGAPVAEAARRAARRA